SLRATCPMYCTRRAKPLSQKPPIFLRACLRNTSESVTTWSVPCYAEFVNSFPLSFPLLPKNPQVSSRAWRAPSLRRKSLPWPLGPTLAETPQSIRRGAAPRSRRNQVVQEVPSPAPVRASSTRLLLVLVRENC